MKNLYNSILTICVIGSAQFANAQQATQDVKYRRSSLHTVLIESESYPKREAVMTSWNNYPFPDKYNNHTVGANKLDPSKYLITEADKVAAGQKKGNAIGGFAKGMASDVTDGIVDLEATEMPLKIEKYIKETKLANQLVAKWFNRSIDGTCNMNLVQERGFYNASELEAGIAKGQVRGMASLGDAGKELIQNTFVVFSKLTFVENEPVARVARDLALTQAQKITVPALQQKAIQAANAGYDKAKEGYSVWTKTWLYQLKWNDSIENVFYSNLWNKKEAFDKSDLFKLEYVGRESSSSLVTFSLKEKRSEEQIIDIATVRNIDNVYAKLQKAYDVFKPKIPVLTAGPITAQIGTKEGLEGGESFEALEMVINPKTGLTEYKKVGKVTVAKNAVWNNSYNAGSAPETLTAENNASPKIDRTTFEGSKKIQPGMLLRQIK